MNPEEPVKWPWWVKFGLLGLSTRSSAMAFFWLSIACGVAAIIAGFWYPRLFWGVLFFGSALMYWLAIHWVDTHDRWHDKWD